MKIRKFVGSSFKEAIELVKKELGPDAVILSSRTIKGGPFGVTRRDAVEVTAAMDYPNDKPDSTNPDRGVMPQLPFTDEILREIRSLREEVGYLKETLRPVVPGLRIGRDKKGLFTALTKQGVDAQFAVRLLEHTGETIGSLTQAISRDVAVKRMIPSEERGYLFVGPPGIGKTTTMSKVAHVLAGSGRHVSIVSLDSGRISAVAYLKELARQVRCDIRLVRNVSELPKIIYKDAERGPVLVDTPGSGFADIMQQKKEVFPGGFPLTTCFMMDAAMDQQATMRAWQQVSPQAVDSIGFTKLDLAGQFGGLYNLAVLTGKPLSFITDGPEVPQDIKVPTPEFLAGLVAGGVREN